MSFLEMMDPLIVIELYLQNWFWEGAWELTEAMCGIWGGGGGGHQVILAGKHIKAPKHHGPMLKVIWYLGWEKCRVRSKIERK